MRGCVLVGKSPAKVSSWAGVWGWAVSVESVSGLPQTCSTQQQHIYMIMFTVMGYMHSCNILYSKGSWNNKPQKVTFQWLFNKNNIALWDTYERMRWLCNHFRDMDVYVWGGKNDLSSNLIYSGWNFTGNIGSRSTSGRLALSISCVHVYKLIKEICLFRFKLVTESS